MFQIILVHSSWSGLVSASVFIFIAVSQYWQSENQQTEKFWLYPLLYQNGKTNEKKEDKLHVEHRPSRVMYKIWLCFTVRVKKI